MSHSLDDVINDLTQIQQKLQKMIKEADSVVMETNRILNKDNKCPHNNVLGNHQGSTDCLDCGKELWDWKGNGTYE